MFLLASDSSSPVDEDDHQPSSINTTVTRRDDERLVSAFALRDNDVLFGRGRLLGKNSGLCVMCLPLENLLSLS